MCGIAGVISRDPSRRPDRAVIDRMVARLHHRGPDDTGVATMPGAALGLKRLSIIDVASGRQPIRNEDESITFVGNGEIFNYRPLREELLAAGHRFRTGSDQEVILHGYELWGDEVVDRLNGQFAFALWDGRKRRLLAARDRAGEKPLYYYEGREDIVFASEIKSLLARADIPRELDVEALDEFLTYEFIIAPRTIFREVRKLPPAHLMTVEDGRVTTRRYWQPPTETLRGRSEALWAEELRSKLGAAVASQMMSEVPLGAFLSGGIDSSSIVALMSQTSKTGQGGASQGPVRTFSIGFGEGSYDERVYAREVATRYRTEHREEVIEPNVVELFDRLVVHLDEPFADVSLFPTFLVSQVAAREVKVVLSGDGGDELFAGYDWYVAERMARRLSAFPGRRSMLALAGLFELIPPSQKKKGLVNKTKRFLTGLKSPPELQHVRWMSHLVPAEKQALYSKALQQNLASADATLPVREALAVDFDDPLNRQLYTDFKLFLADDILVKVDRMSMATSLEARAPFLDRELIELAFRMPGDLKLRGTTRKYILKKAMAPLVSERILHRPKEGFSIPLKNWLKGPLRPWMQELLSESRIRERGLFRWSEVERRLSEHLSGRENHAHQLFPLMVFERWAEEFL